jgi:hypothetical protein
MAELLEMLEAPPGIGIGGNFLKEKAFNGPSNSQLPPFSL